MDQIVHIVMNEHDNINSSIKTKMLQKQSKLLIFFDLY